MGRTWHGSKEVAVRGQPAAPGGRRACLSSAGARACGKEEARSSGVREVGCAWTEGLAWGGGQRGEEVLTAAKHQI